MCDTLVLARFVEEDTLIFNDEREQDIESERSSKDNEEREGIEEGAQENFGFSKFASKRSFKRSSTASTSF